MTKDLSALFAPRAVAVIGASRNPNSVGGDVLRNLITAGFRGPVYPVNPKADYVASILSWPSVEAIPGPVDLAVIAVPAPIVGEVIEACARKGVAAVIVLSAGFKELGAEGARRELQLKTRVRELGMRLVGPNCLGLVNTDPNVRLMATFAGSSPPAGNVAFSSQSGALGVAILDRARQLGIGISQFISVGNKADVSGNDLLEHWEADERTKVVLLYLESFGNPQRFANIARRVSMHKPIACVKGGRTHAGARAASSHTGSLAGTDRAAEALFEHTGVIRVDTVEELFDVAMLLANQPLPGGDRVAIVSNGGGPGILATDACDAYGLTMATLSDDTREALRRALPAEASVNNPVDTIAGADASAMGASVEAVLRDDGVDALLVLYVPTSHSETDQVAHAIVAAAAGVGKPVLSCFMGAHGVPAALRSLEEANVPSYAFPEAAARALAKACRYAAWRARPEATRRLFSDVDREAARRALDAADSDGHLPPEAVVTLLDAYGISQADSRVVYSLAEATAVASRYEQPVAMKAVADGLIHKSDRGGVKLGLDGPAAVEAAWNAFAEGFGETLRAVVIQPMIQGAVEVIVGATRTEGEMPLVMFGMGGVLVELLQDVSFGLAPLTVEAAERLVDSVRAAALLDGFRGRPRGDRTALLDVLLRLSVLITDHSDVLEIDLNPVMVRPPGYGATVVDARVRVKTWDPETILRRRTP